MRKSFNIFFVCLLIFSVDLEAQTLPVGTPVLEDYYRRMQLKGDVDSNVSFTVRPLFNVGTSKQAFSYTPDSVQKPAKWSPLMPFIFAKGQGVFQLLPITWQQQYNSNYPYGWNDGAMIPSRGYETMVSGGFYFKLGPLSVQLRPEYVYAANKPFVGFSGGSRADDELRNFYIVYNNTDLPERFGTNSYKKSFLGQSSIRLTFDPISVGVSNENIWWGPGINNSLIMSNNAPGFRHITLNSTRPIKTYVGHFEFQAVAGRLEATNYPPTAVTFLPNGEGLVRPKRNDWRYFTGFNFNYHPNWVPGLTLGLTRTFNAYGPDIKKFSDYVPFFFPYQKVNTNDGDPISRDQYTSFYARWLFKRARAELYFEYGLNDNSYNYRDFIGSPDHSRTYIFGFRKLLPLNRSDDQQILFSAEVTQLSQSVDRLVREAGSYYLHSEVRQGHTNQGQVMGAGTGPGGNLQHVDINWVSGLKKLGVTFDRYEHNVDFSDAYLSDINGYSRKWVDLVVGIQGEWDYHNLLLNAKLQHITSLNYQWFARNLVPGVYYTPQNTATNFYGQLGITYRF